MQTIAIANRKGGTGKTATARQLAAGLSPHGRVLLVDVDSQASLTDILDIPTEGIYTIGHAIAKQKTLAEEGVVAA